MAEPAAVAGGVFSGWRDLAKRHEGRIALALLFLITIPMLTKVFTSDFGTHIALGRHIVRSHDIPTHELWNYPSLGMENASGGEWVFQAVLFTVFSLFGMYGVSFLCWAVVAGIYYFLYRATVLRGSDPVFTVLALFVFSGFLRIRIQPRPEIFTYLFISLTIYLLSEYYFRDRRKAIYLFPAIVLVWANSHPTFLMAFILWGAFFFDAVARGLWHRNTHPVEWRKRFLAPVLSVLAGLIVCGMNPYGYIRLLEPLHLISRGTGTGQVGVLMSISELTPVKGTGMYVYFQAAAGVTLFSLILGTVGRRVYLLDMFLFAIAFKGAWDSARAVSMMGLFLSPGLALHLSGFVARTTNWWTPKSNPQDKMIRRQGKSRKGGVKTDEEKGKPPPKIPSQRGRILLIAVLVTALSIFGGATLSFSFSQLEYGVGLTTHKFSLAAADFLRKNPVPGKMFNFFDIGGFLDWQLYPQSRTFIDGRTYNRQIFLEHQSVTGAVPGWEDILRKHGVTYVVTKTMDSSGMILPIISPLSSSPDWALVFADGLFVVYVHRTPETREYIREHEIPKNRIYQQVAWEAYHYIYLGVSPLMSYQTMARMYESMGNRQAAIEAIRKALEYADVPALRTRLMQLEQGVPER